MAFLLTGDSISDEVFVELLSILANRPLLLRFRPLNLIIHPIRAYRIEILAQLARYPNLMAKLFNFLELDTFHVGLRRVKRGPAPESIRTKK